VSRSRRTRRAQHRKAEFLLRSIFRARPHLVGVPDKSVENERESNCRYVLLNGQPRAGIGSDRRPRAGAIENCESPAKFCTWLLITLPTPLRKHRSAPRLVGVLGLVACSSIVLPNASILMMSAGRQRGRRGVGRPQLVIGPDKVHG